MKDIQKKIGRDVRLIREMAWGVYKETHFLDQNSPDLNSVWELEQLTNDFMEEIRQLTVDIRIRDTGETYVSKHVKGGR